MKAIIVSVFVLALLQERTSLAGVIPQSNLEINSMIIQTADRIDITVAGASSKKFEGDDLIELRKFLLEETKANWIVDYHPSYPLLHAEQKYMMDVFIKIDNQYKRVFYKSIIKSMFIDGEKSYNEFAEFLSRNGKERTNEERIAWDKWKVPVHQNTQGAQSDELAPFKSYLNNLSEKHPKFMDYKSSSGPDYLTALRIRRAIFYSPDRIRISTSKNGSRVFEGDDLNRLSRFLYENTFDDWRIYAVPKEHEPPFTLSLDVMYNDKFSEFLFSPIDRSVFINDGKPFDEFKELIYKIGKEWNEGDSKGSSSSNEAPALNKKETDNRPDTEQLAPRE